MTIGNPIVDQPKPADALNGLDAHARLNDWRERYRDVGLSIILALQATTIFVVSPLAAVGELSAEPVEVLRFGLAATAILIVNRSLVVGFSVAAIFFVSLLSPFYLRLGASDQIIFLARISITIAFESMVAWIVARAVFAAGRISVHRIMGVVILYLYIGLIFASAYRLASIFLHPSFSGLTPTRRGNLSELMYFSLGALTTSGAGDILPIHPFVRSLANLESLIGQLYPATFVARLITLHAASAESEAQLKQREGSPSELP